MIAAMSELQENKESCHQIEVTHSFVDEDHNDSLDNFLDLVEQFEQEEECKNINEQHAFNLDLFQQNPPQQIHQVQNGFHEIFDTTCDTFDENDITELQNLSNVYHNNFEAQGTSAANRNLPAHDLLAQTLAQFDYADQGYQKDKVVDYIDLTAEDETAKNEDITHLLQLHSQYPSIGVMGNYCESNELPASAPNFYYQPHTSFPELQSLQNYPDAANICIERSPLNNQHYSNATHTDANNMTLERVPTKPHNGTPMLHLVGQDLWHRFHKIGTEMIITKAGRYVYSNSQWMASGNVESILPNRLYIHPESPAQGEAWMRQVISFDKMKLTNNESNAKGHMILHSMRKYQPRIHLIKFRPNLIEKLLMTQQIDPDVNDVTTFIFPETGFTTVTAYQNQQITKLKIERNPFAKGFRDTNKTPHGQTSAQEAGPSSSENFWLE